jgi:hypothetical protein
MEDFEQLLVVEGITQLTSVPRCICSTKYNDLLAANREATFKSDRALKITGIITSKFAIVTFLCFSATLPKASNAACLIAEGLSWHNKARLLKIEVIHGFWSNLADNCSIMEAAHSGASNRTSA